MVASGSPTLSRNYISRWENGKRGVSLYWLPYVAEVLNLSMEQLQEAGVRRRAFLATSSLVVVGAEAKELLASVASGDDSALRRNIAPYDFAMSLASVATRDSGVRRRLVRWMNDGHTSLLRGNAQGTLFKTGRQELIEIAELSMARDEETAGAACAASPGAPSAFLGLMLVCMPPTTRRVTRSMNSRPCSQIPPMPLTGGVPLSSLARPSRAGQCPQGTLSLTRCAPRPHVKTYARSVSR